jgi:DNA-binding CsgD family transcriptional regulator
LGWNLSAASLRRQLGWTDARIARRLGITERGVRKRLATARERVGAHSRAHAAALWSRLNP